MSRGHSIYHYATRTDYATVIADVATQLEVKYVVEEYLKEPLFRVHQSPLVAHDFGLSKAPFYAGLTSFLTLMEDAELPFGYMENRQVPEKNGLAPLSIPRGYRWIYFRPSGFYQSDEVGEVSLKDVYLQIPHILILWLSLTPLRSPLKNALNISSILAFMLGLKL